MIIVNGEKKNTAKTIADVLKESGYDGKLVAVARNGSFVPRASYANTNLQDGDEIEIVAPMQGG